MMSVWTVLIDIIPILAMASAIAIIPLFSEGPPGPSRQNKRWNAVAIVLRSSAVIASPVRVVVAVRAATFAIAEGYFRVGK
jgi:hypothetical protein